MGVFSKVRERGSYRKHVSISRENDERAKGNSRRGAGTWNMAIRVLRRVLGQRSAETGHLNAEFDQRDSRTPNEGIDSGRFRW